MLSYIKNKINKLKYNRIVKQGLVTKYKYQSKSGQLEVWEEDAWGRIGRKRQVTNIPNFAQTNLAKERNIILTTFIDWICEDYYNIRHTWAKQTRWTYNQLKKFDHWLEHTRWY